MLNYVVLYSLFLYFSFLQVEILRGYSVNKPLLLLLLLLLLFYLFIFFRFIFKFV